MDTQTLYKKLSAVPLPIKTWLGSDAVIESIEELEGDFILPRGSSATVSKIIQKLQIKDILPEYFSGEVASELNLEKDKATHITGEIKKNIFSPIKKDFSDYGIDIDLLDKFQMPIIKSTPATPSPEKKNPLISKPNTLSDIGWSKTAGGTSGAVAMPVPKPIIPTPPPAPVMLHEDTTFKAAERNASFTLAKPGGGAEMSFGKGPAIPVPPRPAVLEFPRLNNQPKISIAEIKSPAIASSTASSSSRSINQITSSFTIPAVPSQKPPAAMPVPVPKPPVPATMQAQSSLSVPVPKPPIPKPPVTPIGSIVPTPMPPVVPVPRPPLPPQGIK